MYVLIIIIILLASIDAFFIGMYLKLQKGFKFYYNFIITLVIFIISIITYFISGLLTELLTEFISFETSYIVGIVYLILGVKNILSKDEKKNFLTTGAIIIIGLIMSADCFATCIALTLNYGNIFTIPILITAIHLLFLFIGNLTAKYIKASHKANSIISSCCLFLVSALNFTGVF